MNEPMPPEDQEDERKNRADRAELARTDADLARITEDLIDILIARGVIQFTDFPARAQTKLLQRRHTRSMLSRRLQLLDDDDDHGLI